MHTFLLLLVTIIWGSTFFIVKDTVSSVNENMIVFGRTFLAAISMILFLLLKNKASLLNKKAIKYGTILGFLLAITYISQTIGLKFTSSGHSAFITGSAVVMVPIILFFFYQKKTSTKSTLAIMIVTMGLFLLTFDPASKINYGDAITLVTALSCAAHIVLAGIFVKKADVLAIITWQFISASIMSFIAFIITDNNFVMPDDKAIGAIFYLGFMGTLFCYFVSVWAQKYVSSIKVALIFSLEPVFAALFGYFILNEVLNNKELTGAALIMSGIIWDQIYKNTFRPDNLPENSTTDIIVENT